jgi:hypothetical protein
MRRLYLLVILAAIVVFLGVSALLARVFSVDGAERTAITELVKVEARGDANGVIARILGCAHSGACRSRVTSDVAALTRPGAVSILEINTSAGFSLASTTGTARVAWKTPSSLPIVQCVRVRRAGDVVHQWRIELLELGPRIHSDADCPRRF